MKTVAVISPTHQRYLRYCKTHRNQINVEAIFREKQMGRYFDEVRVLADTDEWNSKIARAYEEAQSRRRRNNE